MKTLLLFCLMVSCAPAYACGNGECDPEPEPETPSVSHDGEAVPLNNRIYYAECGCDKVVVAWGLESLKYRTRMAVKQCNVQREQVLNCPNKEN